MAVHKIEMSQPAKQVLHNDIEFDIYSDSEKLGTLTISKGSIDWTPKGKHKAKKIRWERFAVIMGAIYEGRKVV